MYSFPVLPAGTMYDADHQCRLQYGTDDTEICTSKEVKIVFLFMQVVHHCNALILLSTLSKIFSR